VSHASEDKDDFARPLAEGLQARDLKVWFDEFTLTIGDSLRRSIDRGLAHSRFGVVVMSHAFLRKEWPQKELDGLVAREVGGVKVILPVWHGITAEQLRACSPMLADRVAANSAHGLDHVIAEIARAVSHNQQAPTARVPSRPLPVTDVRVTLRKSGRSTNFVIENLGPGLVHDVGCELDTAALKESPIIDGDWQEKLPVDVLRPGAHVEMIAALSAGTGTTFRARLWWREDDGRVEERNEKVSLQNW
jgi:TIR domain